MEVRSVRSIIAELEAAKRARRGAQPGVIAFDADGTLWSGDVGDDFFRGVLAEGRIEPLATKAMRSLALEFHVPGPRAPVDLAAALYDAYRQDRVPEHRICEMVAFICAGFTTDEVAALAGRVVRSGGLMDRRHPEVVGIVEWAKREGVEAFVVSASPRAIVIAGAGPLGFDDTHIVAVTPIVTQAGLSAKVERPIPYAEGKVTCLRGRIGSRPIYGAFGDNVFDIPLLCAADVKVAVRPKPRLLARAGEVPGLVRME